MKYSILIGIASASLVFLIQLLWIPSEISILNQNLLLSYFLFIPGILFFHYRMKQNKIYNEVVFIIFFALTNGFLISTLDPPSQTITVLEDFIKTVFNNYLIIIGFLLVGILNIKTILGKVT